MTRQEFAAGKLRMLKKLHLQVGDIIHDGPALNRMTPRVDEMIVDLKHNEHNQNSDQV